MKAMKATKLDAKELYRTYQIGTLCFEDVQKRVNRVNRSFSWNRSAIEKRSKQMQQAYIDLLQFDKKDIQKIEAVYLKEKDSDSIQLTLEKLYYKTFNKTKKIQFDVLEAYVAILTGYKFI